jgi:hypothetical protein
MESASSQRSGADNTVQSLGTGGVVGTNLRWIKGLDKSGSLIVKSSEQFRRVLQLAVRAAHFVESQITTRGHQRPDGEHEGNLGDGCICDEEAAGQIRRPGDGRENFRRRTTEGAVPRDVAGKCRRDEVYFLIRDPQACFTTSLLLARHRFTTMAL